MTVARPLTFPPGAIHGIDRGYVEFACSTEMIHQGVLFVTRLKDNAVHAVLRARDMATRGPGVRDELIALLALKYLLPRSAFGWCLSSLGALPPFQPFTHRGRGAGLNGPFTGPPPVEGSAQLVLEVA